MASFSLVAAGLFAAALAIPTRQKPPAPTPAQVEFFETKVRPLLADNCFRCHGKGAQMGGLRLDTAKDAARVLSPGDPEKSLLIQAVRQTGDLKMPPGGKHLSADAVRALEEWVKMGAPWPDTSTAKPEAALWSLQPVRKPPLPKTKVPGKNPIDAFIRAKLEAKGLSPAPEADKRTLIRRLSFDLIGLPPTPAEVDAFVADKTAKAYDKLVDRLLASPHYGERWARLWLDVARYADTKGYVFEEDRNYYNAYTYRDWVIRAFNEDLPYDRFVTEQIAADLLPEVREGEDKRPLAALGFLTVGRRFLNSQPDIVDDRIDVTMRGLQGFTVACARCHDHKFDPIPTQDYYSLYGVFASSEEVASPISDRTIRDPWEANNEKISAAETAIRTLIDTQVRRLRDPNLPKSDEVKATLQGFREGVIPEGATLGKLLPAFEASERDHLVKLQSELASLKKNAPPTPELAMALRDRSKPGDAYIFRRGNPGSNGGPAPRRFLLALSKPGVERELWKSGSGRLELAKAITSRDNPLTARVFVNRVWMHHFGAGLVRTPSDFGRQGDKPTHPELLDYLAASFMQSGWSIKRLHRLIVTSAAYRQSSEVSKADYDADPDNRLWSRMNRRRLDLESMRDSLLSAAGRLDLKSIGGKSVDLWQAPYTPRRAVYGFIERQNLPGIFRTFDFASPDSTSARRFQTTVPQQALFFMNSPFAVEQAEALAERPEIVKAQDDGQRIRRLYRLLFSRLPAPEELAAGLAYLHRGSPAAPAPEWQYGYGRESNGRVQFNPLTHFADNGYRIGSAFPDPQLGYILLNSTGGHPGHDAGHAVIRRWTAPADTTVVVEGTLHHPRPEGDGVHARVVAGGTGQVAEWSAHNAQVRTTTGPIVVRKGETLDFIVDPVASDAFDGFSWSLTLRLGDGSSRKSAAAFGPPPPEPLTRLALYTQALLMTNEFLFVD